MVARNLVLLLAWGLLQPFVAQAAEPVTPQWKQVPVAVGEEIAGLVSHNKQLFLGTSLGLLGSKDGLTWAPVAGLPEARVTSVDLGSTIWVVFDYTRLFKSADGVKWTEVPFCDVAPDVREEGAPCNLFTVLPASKQILVGTPRGVWKQDGTGWVHMGEGLGGTARAFQDGETLYVTTPDEKTALRMKGGVGEQVPAPPIAVLDLFVLKGKGLLALGQVGNGAETLAVAHSKDGKSWQQRVGTPLVSASLSKEEEEELSADDLVPDAYEGAAAMAGNTLLVAVSNGLFSSSDEGKSWLRVAAEPCDRPLFLATVGKRVLAACGNEVWSLESVP